MNIPDKGTKPSVTTKHITSDAQGKQCNTHVLQLSSWQFESIDGLREGKQVAFDIMFDHRTQMFRFRCAVNGKIEYVDVPAEVIQPELAKLT